MVVVTAKFKSLSGMRAKVIELAAPCVEATRKEQRKSSVEEAMELKRFEAREVFL